MSETTKNRLYLMITITNRVMGATHFLDFYRAFGAPVVFTALGRGTASNDVLSYLGLEATEKSVMFSVVTPAVKEVLMRELVDTMRIDRPGSGIAVCLHLSSVGGRTALNYLISGESDAQPDMTVKEEEQMNENAYQLIVAITNTGYTDAVMEAASAAGAAGTSSSSGSVCKNADCAWHSSSERRMKSASFSCAITSFCWAAFFSSSSRRTSASASALASASS